MSDQNQPNDPTNVNAYLKRYFPNAEPVVGKSRPARNGLAETVVLSDDDSDGSDGVYPVPGRSSD